MPYTENFKENNNLNSFDMLIKALATKKKELKVSNTELASITGISEKTIGGIFNGSKTDIKLSTVIALAEALNCVLSIG